MDPYDLLEIPAELRPPTHYQLLGIDDFESDLEVISHAAKQRSTYLHRIAAGPQRKAVQQLLNQVAVARRTLLNPQSKQAYDEQLLADTEEHGSQLAGGQFQVATETMTAATSETSKQTGQPRSRRRKKSTWDEYKLHLLSASILLLIVGIIWFVNRGAGQRRAAKAGAAQTAPAVAQRKATTQRKSSAPTRPALTQRPAVARSKPAARRSGRPSLTPDFDVQAFLSEGAPGMSKQDAAKQGKAGNTKQPKHSVAIDLPANWQPAIPIKDEFTAKLQERYQFDGKKVPCKLERERVVIQQVDKKSKYGFIRHKSIKVKPGQALALDIRLATPTNQPGQIGLSIGPMRLAVSGSKGELQIRAKHNDQKQGPMKVLGKMDAASSPATLVVVRSKENPKQFYWLARSGENDLSGKISVANLKAQPQLVTIFFTTPGQEVEEPVWFDNLRYGKFANAPEWKPSDIHKL